MRFTLGKVSGLPALAAVLALGCAFATPLAAFSAPLPVGTNVFGVLSTDLNTADVNEGDGFSLQITTPYPNDDPAYAGAYIRGHVTSVQRAGQGKPAQIDLAFDRIVFPDGLSAPITGHLVRVAEKKQSSIVQQAAGAAVGMIIGNYIGKHLGTNLGGLIGAGGGFIYANNLKTNFTIQRGSTVVIQTDSEVPRPQARE